MDASLAIVVIMTFNAAIAVAWAWAAFLVARRERLRQWPVPWRWLVFFWMGTKAALFIALDVAIGFGISEWVALGVVVVFTYSHTWAYLRWRRLPDGQPAVEQLAQR